MTEQTFVGPVPPERVGDSGPAVQPGDDPAIYGTATLEPRDPVEARSFQSFVLTYTVGRLGLDDSGAIRVCFRAVTDAGKPQTSDPIAANYVTASCTGAGNITLDFDPLGGQRPWNLALTARLGGGYLKAGDQIEIVFGDTRHGSPGMLIQTFAEGGLDFRVMADVIATGNFVPVRPQLSVPVVAGPPDRWVAILPTLRRPGEPFRLGLKAEDRWGNPTAQAKASIRLEATIPVDGLPTTLDYGPGERGRTIEDLHVAAPGELWVKVFADEIPVAEAGPLIVRAGPIAGFWGDLHGQTGETVGTNLAESYFDFARNLAFLDVTSHQANDFQITPAFWDHLNQLTAAWHDPGRFTVLPGYEWSGNTAVGGDHNVFFATEGRAIRRSSHALLIDRTDSATDANTLTDLYRSLADEDCVLYAHVGGRYANIAYDHDPKLETAVEVHSAWGTFEWILTDGFPLGRRVGVVCNSDGHKGRPGASYPGSSTFGAYGGLTCFLTDRLDRATIFEAMRRRHHYGTTGRRLFLDVRAAIPGGGVLFERNPAAVPETPAHPTDTAAMGDIVRTSADEVSLSVEIAAAAPIERVELRAGTTVVATVRPYALEDLGKRIRVLWSGAEYRGRGRDTAWRGRAVVTDAAITRFERINLWNPERLFEQRGSRTIVWDTVTTGNFMGFDLWLDRADRGRLAITTNHGDLDLELAEIGLDDVVLEAGGLARRLRAVRLPDTNPHRHLKVTHSIPLHVSGDTPVWVCVTTEDGHQAWSSPIYLIR